MTHAVQLGSLIGLLLIVLPTAVIGQQTDIPPARDEPRRPKRPEDDVVEEPQRRPSEPILQLTSDYDCVVEIDGERVAELRKDIVQQVVGKPGKHLIQAAPIEVDCPPWKGEIQVPETGQEIVIIELAARVEACLEEGPDSKSDDRFVPGTDTVHDKQTGSTWAVNAFQDLKWNAAAAHCARAQFGGHSGWHLPTVEQLHSIYWEDHPQPEEEEQPGVKEGFVFRRRGPSTMAPVLVYQAFEGLPQHHSIWTSEKKKACSFLGKFECWTGVGKGAALCVSGG